MARRRPVADGAGQRLGCWRRRRSWSSSSASLPGRGREGAAPSRPDDGHPRLARDAGGVWLLARADARRVHRGDLLRQRGGDHRPCAARPVARGTREGSGGRGGTGAAQAAPDDGARPARRARGGPADRGGPRRRPAARPSGSGSPSTACSSTAASPSTNRCSPASRCRSTSGPGTQVDGRHDERIGLVRDARRTGRPRHHPCPDRPPRRASAGLEGADLSGSSTR